MSGTRTRSARGTYLVPRQRIRFGAAVLAGAWLTVATVGCAGIDLGKWSIRGRAARDAEPQPPADGIEAHRTKKDAPTRMTEAVSDFERRRNDAQFQAAESHWRQGNSKRCRESLEKLLARRPDHRDSILLLADVHLEANHSDEAIEVLERGVAACPSDAEIAYKLGVALEAGGRRNESLQWLEQAAAKEPANERYRTALAQAKEQAPDAPAAETALTGDETAATSDAVAQLQATEPPHLPAGPALQDRRAAAAAAARTEGTEGSDATPPDAAPAASTLTRSDLAFQAALADWDGDRKQACEAKLLQLIVEDPDYVDAAILLAEVELDSGREAEARGRVERLVIRHPHDPRIRRACGMTYETLGEKELAANCYAEAERLESEPPTNIITHREESRRRAGRRQADTPPEIEPALLETDPASVGGTRAASASVESPDGSGAAPSSARPARPDQAAGRPAEPKLSAGEAPTAPSILRFESEESPSAAVRPGTEAKSRSAERPKPSAAELLERGSAALAERKIEVARDAFLNAIRTDSKNSQTSISAAVAALKQEQPELALQLATEGLRSLPRSAGLYRIQGTAAYQLGRYAEAEAALRQSLSLDNSQALSYFLLGSVQNRLGKHEAADEQFRYAARLDRRYAVRK